MYIKAKDFLNILLMNGYSTNSILYVSNYVYGYHGYNPKEHYHQGNYRCRNIQSLLASTHSEYYITSIHFNLSKTGCPESICISKEKKDCEEVYVQEDFEALFVKLQKFKRLSIALEEFRAVNDVFELEKAQ